jgi:hypothetical protein
VKDLLALVEVEGAGLGKVRTLLLPELPARMMWAG